MTGRDAEQLSRRRSRTLIGRWKEARLEGERNWGEIAISLGSSIYWQQRNWRGESQMLDLLGSLDVNLDTGTEYVCKEVVQIYAWM